MKKNAFKVQTISVYISTTLVLLLLGIMGIMYTGTKSLSRNMQQNLTMSVVIKNGIKEADIQKLKENIDNDSRVHSSVYISKEQALAEESEALQANPEEILGYNPYEASIEITLHHEYSTNEHLADISETISERKEVKEGLVMKVEFKDVYEVLRQDLAFYTRELKRAEEKKFQRETILYLMGQKRAIEMAMERLDLELNYGLGVGGGD